MLHCRGLSITCYSMDRVQSDGLWSMFDPTDVPELAGASGHEFARLYGVYEERGLAMRTTTARSLMRRIILSQIETGTPFMLYSDSINGASFDPVHARASANARQRKTTNHTLAPSIPRTCAPRLCRLHRRPGRQYASWRRSCCRCLSEGTGPWTWTGSARR